MKKYRPKKHRITHIAPDCWGLQLPDGYWVGEFRSVADALDWVYREQKRLRESNKFFASRSVPFMWRTIKGK